MKKLISVFFSMIIGVLFMCVFAGCSTYQVPENHCIVGLYKDYQLYSDTENKLCEPIDKTIKGIEKQHDTNYYSVIKGATYTVITDGFIDDCAGFGRGVNGYDFVPAWWQGDVITSFVKSYGEKSGKQDETFFETSFESVREITTNPQVVFSENCTVKVTIEPYLFVGGIFEIIEKDSDVLDSNIGNYLNQFGMIHETDGFYYLLLNDEVCIHEDAWKTNFDITDYKYEKVDRFNNAIQAQFTAKAPVVAENEDWFLHVVCRTLSGKYFVYPVTYQGAQGFTMPIREHELKLTFEKEISI